MTRALLLLILVLYLAVGALFAVRIPAWQAPDEPAHYNYIRQIAQRDGLDGCCPVIAPGDWDAAYLDQLKSARFAPDLLADLDTVQYEDHQPPLYYLLAAPVYRLTDGDLTALRLFSVALGSVIVLCAYGVGVTLLPERPQVGLMAAAFVAFQPMHLAILASVNNDALGWALAALILLASVRYLLAADAWLRPWHLGLLAGVGLVTKATVYPLAGVAGLAVLLRWWHTHPRPPLVAFVRDAALYLLPALALGLTWWLRNLAVYGFPDFLGLRAHDAVVVGQPRTAELIAEVGAGGYVARALADTYNSFWGQFGWMALPLRGNPSVDWIYPAFGLLLLAGLGGWLLDAWARQRDTPFPGTLRSADGLARRRAAWGLLGVTALLALLAYAYYNTEFLQFQGRYTFTLLIPLGVALGAGLDVWRRALVGGGQRGWWLPPLALCALALLDAWLVWTVIAPNLAY